MYNYTASGNPLTKVKTIKKVWEFEEKFYGERRTKLTERERVAADLMFADIIKNSDVIEEQIEKEIGAPGESKAKK